MYKTLRGESLRAVLPRLIICLALALLFLGLSCAGAGKLLTGPEELGSLEIAEMEGRYVSFDASEVIVAFASLSSKSDSGSTTLETYYLLPVGDTRYMAVMDRKEHNGDVLGKAMEQSHEYYLGDLDTLHTLGKIQGTVKVLEEDMESYMADCIDNYQLPGYVEGQDSTGLLVPLQVELDRVGFLSAGQTWTLFALGLCFLLLFVLQLVLVMTGFYQRQVRSVLGDREDAFPSAAVIERVRVGQYIWYPKGAFSRILKTDTLIWGYTMPEPLVVSKYRWPVALYDREQRLTRIQFADKKHCEEFLSAIAAQGHPFRMGYTSALAEQFQRDYEGFVRDAERQEAAE